MIEVFDRLDAEAEAADREYAAGGVGGSIPIRRGGRGDQGGGLGANSTEELRFVEGTILLHFNFAMKQDHNLASCVLKGFQRRAAAAEVGRACTPFRLALLLSLSRIQRFSQPVLDLVQDIVSDCLVYDHAREGSAWLENEEEIARGGRYGSSGGGAEDAGSDGEGGGGGGIGSGSCSSARVVQRVLLTVIASSRGWDHLMESFLKIGLQLLDRGGAGAAGVASYPGAGTSGMLEKLQGAQPHRASLRASHLGRVVLMETFKTHEVGGGARNDNRIGFLFMHPRWMVCLVFPRVGGRWTPEDVVALVGSDRPLCSQSCVCKSPLPFRWGCRSIFRAYSSRDGSALHIDVHTQQSIRTSISLRPLFVIDGS